MGLLLIPYGASLVIAVNTLSAALADRSRFTVHSSPAIAASEALARQGTLHSVFVASLASLLLVTLFGALAAYLMSDRLLQPIHMLIGACTRIAAGAVRERVVVDHTTGQLADLARGFNDMLDRLECAAARQKAFVADAAHEMRTPLAALRANLELVANGDPNRTSAQSRVGHILDDLDQLIEDLLTLSHDSQWDHGATILLGPLVEEAVGSLHRVAVLHGVAVNCRGDGSVQIYGSESLLTILFRNLIENAILYTRPRSTVEIHLNRLGPWVSVAVADTGEGIPPDECAKAFDRFYRGRASQLRHPRGNGLGLAIVAHVAEQHGGTVRVTSEVGSGSVFEVLLPAPPVEGSPGEI